ncbi:site-specific DNA-methyltransferase [Metabacillus herbersteinensis]|uniref:Site-specific DNA-methyltransferase n=1 Tax=Metabacillus herbersteinensis TaxID=283816 RepID=A0ABV6GJ89_9BACI
MREQLERNENLDISNEKLKVFQKHFPNCITKDGALDFKKLEAELAEEVDIVKEGYSLNWLGKSYAKVIANLETETVVSPDLDHNLLEVNKDSQNVYIKGDNLDVLKHLVNAYAGKIKTIYIDPPYNTGSDDFVYQDNFIFTPEKLAELANVEIEEAQRILDFTERKSSSHSAWLTFMYPRLFIARELLSDDGAIFISIDDNELTNLKLLCDEIFGEENSKGNIVRATGQTTGQDSGGLGSSFDFVLVYTKTLDVDLSGIPLTEHDLKRFANEDERGNYAYDQMRKTGSNDRRGDRPNMYYPVIDPDGNEVYPIAPAGYESCWRFEKKSYERLLKEDYILWKKTKRDDKEIWWPYVKYYLEGRTKRPSPLWDDLDGNKKATRDLRALFDGKKIFDHSKPIEFIRRILQISESQNSIVLDFFSGSSTTAHAVMQQNAEDNEGRKYILAQISEPTTENSEAYQSGYKYITEIGIDRIKRAAKKIKEETNADIDYGFKIFETKPITEQVSENDLNKMLTFKGSIVSDDTFLNEFGKDTVLTTWMLEDGHPLNINLEEIDLGNYTAYKVDNTIYLLDGNFTIDEHLKTLIEKIEKEEQFIINKLVLFGYSFATQTIASLNDNMKHLRNGRKSADIHVEVRY